MGAAIIGLIGAVLIGAVLYYLQSVRPNRQKALQRLTEFRLWLEEGVSPESVEYERRIELLVLPLVSGGANAALVGWLRRVDSARASLVGMSGSGDNGQVAEALLKVPGAISDIVDEIDADIRHPWALFGRKARVERTETAAHRIRSIYMDEWLLPAWARGRTRMTRWILRRRSERR